MRSVSLRSAGTACALAVLLSVSGCQRHRKTTSAPNTTDYQPLIPTIYQHRRYAIAWPRDGKPTPAALGFIQAFADAGRYGLRPEDYDANRWDDRIQMLSPKEEEAVAQFDVAVTVCVMRFISVLRIGRVNPQHFRFDINVADKKYDLAEFVSDNAVDVVDVPALLKKVEPDSDVYRRTEAALAHYIDL